MTVRAGAGTPQEEIRRKALRGVEESNRRPLKTHCVNGHEYTPENTRIRTNGSRCCRICDRERNKRRRGGDISLECFQCGDLHTVTYETAIRNARKGKLPRCMSCVNSRPNPRLWKYPRVTKKEHREYWLNGGLTNDEWNPGPADKGKPLKWPELVSIAAGLELWLDERAA